MNIHLNGKPHQVKAATNIAELLIELGLDGRPVVVEHRLQALLPKEYPEAALTENDQVEIITIVAGG